MLSLVFQGQNFRAFIEIVIESKKYVVFKVPNVFQQDQPLNPVSYEIVGPQIDPAFLNEREFTPQTLLLIRKNLLTHAHVPDLTPGHFSNLFENLRVRTQDAVLRITQGVIKYEELFV